MLLQAIDIKKDFGQEEVLRSARLELQAGEMLSILGRSGSGKTTLLKILAGLESPDSGQVLLEGRDITRLAPNERNIVYLYQEPLLFPHLDVFENVAFGLRLRRLPGEEVSDRVQRLLESLELPEQADKMPHQLSGGQRQRVAFGRALAVQPKVLLLDEPFGALDTETRASMQELLQHIARKFDITALFVTHDLKEAILMGSRIGLMQEGELKVYENKQAFIGDTTTGVQQELDFWRGLG
ncbi:MAG: ABC transporter ATP-binding protein [Phaeodactylibacter sp.]|nr:ABC transporter ATP-binding protein [Phaeodactylibacter sp.]MCB9300906.1 ABC transporter ATP-binding protein [Lewinellaceae bacterium]